MKVAIQTGHNRSFWLPIQAVELYLSKKNIKYIDKKQCKYPEKDFHYCYILENGEEFDPRIPRTIKARSEPELIETIEELIDLLRNYENGYYKIIDVTHDNCAIGSDGIAEEIYYKCPHCFEIMSYESFKSQKGKDMKLLGQVEEWTHEQTQK